MQKKVVALALLLIPAASAFEIKEESFRLASYLTIFAVMVTLPAFIALYINIRRTNLGHVLVQPFLAMFIGFIGIMINSILDIYGVAQGREVDNISMVMSINRGLSSLLIAAGCVMLFFTIKSKGLFSLSYYQHKKKHR